MKKFELWIFFLVNILCCVLWYIWAGIFFKFVIVHVYDLPRCMEHLVRLEPSSVNEGAIPLVWHGHLLSWVHITIIHRLVTHVTRLEGLIFLLPFLRAAAILDFAKGAFFEANRGKNHTLYLYLPELLICVKGITEVVFYFVFSFTVKEGSKKGLKKERRPIANR